MRRKWRHVTDALLNLKEQGFIEGYLKERKVASVTIFMGGDVRLGPYSLAEAYAWLEGCEAMGAAAWKLPL